MCYSILEAVVDTKLFEKCGVNNVFSFYSKELALDGAHVLSQLVQFLPKVLGSNALDVMNESTSESRGLLPEVPFLENLYDLLNHSEKEEEIKVKEVPTTRRNKTLFLSSQGNELGQAIIG